MVLWRVWALLGLPFVCAACVGDAGHTPLVDATAAGGSEAGGAAAVEAGTGGTSSHGGAGAEAGTPDPGFEDAGAANAGGPAGEAGEAGAPPAGGGALGHGGAAPGGQTSSGGAETAGQGGSGPVNVSVDDFADYQVVQRVPRGTSQMVSVRGNLVDAEARTSTIEARVVDFATGMTEVVPWTAIAAPAERFSGQLEVPQGGWYRIAVRAVDEADLPIGEALGTHRWGVGINILLIGQSNMVGNGNARTFTPVTSDLSALYGNDNRWKHLADPYDGGGTAGEIDYDSWIGASLVPSLANALAATFAGVPVGFVAAARGSSPLHGSDDIAWVKRSVANHADTTNLYGNSLSNARAAGGVELIVMHQGETDATNETSESDYEADLRTLLAHYREDLYDTVPLFMCQIGRSTTPLAEKNRTDQNLQRIRSAQHDSDDGVNVLLAAVAIDLPLDPSAPDHYTKAGHDLLGARIANAIGYHFGKSQYYRGPTLTSATYESAARDAVEVHVQHRGGTDISPASGINGFQVLDDGSPVLLRATTRKNANTISIALEEPITGVASVRYLYGKLAVNTLSGAVHDDTNLELPLEPTAQDLIVQEPPARR
jgi:hypothetical protein